MLAATSCFIVVDVVVVLLSLSGIISSDDIEKSRAEDDDIPVGNEYFATGLEEHNKYRALHHSPPLVLDDKLNELALKCADYYAEKKDKPDHSCPFKYKNQGSKDEPYGENIYFRNNTDRDVVTSTKHGIKLWYEEMRSWSFTTHSPKSETKSVTHFTQLAWKASEKLGMGYKIHHGIFMVALYDPPGNIKDQFKDNVLPLSSPDDSDYENDCDYDNSSAVSNVLIFSTKLTYLLACAMSHCVLKLLLYLYEIE